MKKLYIILFFAFIAVFSGFAQERGRLTPEQHKQFREYKMKFLAQEMSLKDEASKKFFEMYNQLSDERHEIRHNIRDINRKIQDNTATEEDYSTLNRLKEQEAEIEKKYDIRFATFLSNKEIFEMKKAETTFTQKLHKMKQKKAKKGKK